MKILKGVPLSPHQRGWMILAIPVSSLMVTLGMATWLQVSLMQSGAWVKHTQRVHITTKRLQTALLDAERGIQGYRMTGQRDLLSPYTSAIAIIPPSLQELAQLVQDNPTQTQQLQNITLRIQQTLNLLAQELSPPATDRPLYPWLIENQQRIKETRQAIEQFLNTEKELLVLRERQLQQQKKISGVLLVILTSLGISSSLLTFKLFQQLERELQLERFQLQANNQQLAQALTAQQQAEQELQKAYQQLQHFTSDASHELRTPLAAILSNAQVGLLTPAENPAQIYQRLQKIVNLTQSMSTLVQNLLFLARSEQLPQPLQTFDLRIVVQQSCELIQPEIQQKNLSLQSSYPPHPVWLQGEPHLLQQAITNILQNACHYTPSQGQITLTLNPQKQHIALAIQDTGIGIPESALPHIFDRFYRVDPSRHKGSGGFGLGLAIAQQIIHLHQGQITATSTPQQGTTFQMIFPHPLGTDES